MITEGAITVESGPAVEPVSLDEAKSHCRVDIEADDTLLESLIKAARQWVEVFTGRALITQTLKLQVDTWPVAFFLPRPPFQSITGDSDGITYLDEQRDAQTLSTSLYQADTASEPGRVALEPDQSWPSLEPGRLNAAAVTWTAGYGAAGSDVPDPIKQSMLLLVGHWYEHREEVVMGGIPQKVPMAAESLLWAYRVLEV
jgi:uncharacterized phiE125 gp8 family phage protein